MSSTTSKACVLPQDLVKRFEAAGLMPHECTAWSLVCVPGRPVKIVSECNVSEADLRLIADSLKSPELPAILHKLVLRGYESKEALTVEMEIPT